MGFSFGSSKNKNSNSTNYTPNPASQGMFNSAWNSAQGLIGKSLPSYTGELAPGLSAGQTQATGLADAQLGTGSNAVGQGVSTAGSVAGYTPQSVQAGQLSSTDLGSYMSPYLSNVADRVLSDTDRSRQIALNNQAGDFTKAGAFGGSREGVADAGTNEAYGRIAADQLANLYDTGYSNAQGAAQSDIASRLQAGLANQSAGLTGAALNLSAANTLGSLGQAQQGMSLNDVGLINSLGTQAQQTQGAQDAANYANYQYQNAYPLQQAGLYEGLLGTLPALYAGANTRGTGTQSNTGIGFTYQFKMPGS